jgi:hypothetical protein
MDLLFIPTPVNEIQMAETHLCLCGTRIIFFLLWDMMLHILAGRYQCFEGSCISSEQNNMCISALKMEAAHSSEMLVTNHLKCHNPEHCSFMSVTCLRAVNDCDNKHCFCNSDVVSTFQYQQ